MEKNRGCSKLFHDFSLSLSCATIHVGPFNSYYTFMSREIELAIIATWRKNMYEKFVCEARKNINETEFFRSTYVPRCLAIPGHLRGFFLKCLEK